MLPWLFELFNIERNLFQIRFCLPAQIRVVCDLAMVAEFQNQISQTLEEIKSQSLFKTERVITRLLNEQAIRRTGALVSAYPSQE
jgi:hypothetical protein